MPGIARHTPELESNKAVRLIVVDTALLPHVGDALGNLTFEWAWTEVGDTVDEIVSACMDMVLEYYDMKLIGSVQMFIATVPDGWLLMDGTTYDKDDYPELYDVLPAGIKTATQFTLPDLDDVFPMGVTAAGDILSTGGENTTNLTVAQLPSHSHSYTPPTLTIDAETPTTPVPTAGVGSPTQTGTTGSGDDIDNRPDFRGFFFAVYAGRT